MKTTKSKSQELGVLISKLPKKYKNITMGEVLDSDDEKLTELKQWCIDFNKYQFNNALNFLKDEQNIINISNSTSI